MRFPGLFRLTFLALLEVQRVSSNLISGRSDQIFQFETRVFIENVAVRPNGDLLLTTFDQAKLYNLNLRRTQPLATVIAQPANINALTGIVEIAPDVFAFNGGILAASFVFERGSMGVYVMDAGQPDHPVRLVASIPDSAGLNGMVSLPDLPHIVLTPDSATGRVFRIDTATGAVDVAFEDVLLGKSNDTSRVPVGANGFKMVGSYLYFTNSGQGLLGRVKLNEQGDKMGDIEIITTTDVTATAAFDDLAVTSCHVAYVTKHPKYIMKITPGGTQEVILGGDNSTVLLNPTSAVLGRKEGVVYIVTAGDVANPNGKGGQVVKLSL